MYVFAAIAIGFVSAVLSGMFGIGGASVSTPSLRLILDASPAIALGTTLPVTIPTSASAAITYWRQGHVDFRVAGFCILSGVAGASAGALLTRYLNLHYLMLATGVMVLYVSGVTIRRGLAGKRVVVDADGVPGVEAGVPAAGRAAGDGRVTEGSGRTPEPERAPSAAVTLLIGLGAGLMSGLLGVGGAVLLIPGFLYLLRMPIRRSFATSLAVISIIAIPGTIVHSLLGHISWSLVLYLIAGSVPGAYLGARLNMRTAERLLYVLFGALLGCFGVLFIVSETIRMIH